MSIPPISRFTDDASDLSGGIADHPFTLVIITTPAFFPGEAACLEGLLAAGLEKLHLRKPEASKEEMENLLQKIDARWHPRLVLHPWAGTAGRPAERVELAARYGIAQIHCSLKEIEYDLLKTIPVVAAIEAPGVPKTIRLTGEIEAPILPKLGPVAGATIALSSSLHSWEEISGIGGRGLSYVFLSPVFHSISKPGYAANPGLLHRPVPPYPCKVLGLGGIDKDRIGELILEGWDGAAMLGWIWEEPGAAVERYKQLKKIIASHFP